jgi:hypothetical protein
LCTIIQPKYIIKHVKEYSDNDYSQSNTRQKTASYTSPLADMQISS